jgi:hypothetical protein
MRNPSGLKLTTEAVRVLIRPSLSQPSRLPQHQRFPIADDQILLS